jgi:predicted transposase YdaD
VRALLDRAAANRAVVQGLKAKRDPAILEIKDEGRKEGYQEGHQEGRAQMARTAIEGLCEILEIPFGPERQALLHTLDAATLEALYAQIRTQRRWA